MRFTFALLIALFAIGAADASIVLTGSGFNPEANATASGSVGFSVSGDILTLVLTNTGVARTTSQGNALTGVAFDVAGTHGPLVLSSLRLTDSSDRIWRNKLSSNDVNALPGSWTSKLGSTPLGEYGVATTGFNGRFHGGSLWRGNSSPDYGIVADGTFNGTNLVFGGAKFPFVQNSLTFSFTGASGLSEANVKNVQLLFGTDGRGIVSAAPPVAPDAAPADLALPEPTTLTLWSVGALGCALAYRRRKQAG